MGLVAPRVWLRPRQVGKLRVEQDEELEVLMRYQRASWVPCLSGMWFQDLSLRGTLSGGPAGGLRVRCS